eukprot:GEMP01011691.1.p1 GENE.GEMP01011691.1~~GEMP01011691.1.p1  ORF type:complete len:675 (+),score=139.27 GEMP01011691.1:306-2330(+)
MDLRSFDRQNGSTSSDVHISSPSVTAPTKTGDSAEPRGQAPPDIIAEIGRLALQLDCGQEEVTSPMKQKVLEALNWPRKSGVLPDDTYSEIPASLLQSPISRVLEDNSNLRRDLMRARREVLRFKMDAQEQRMRMKELVGRQMTSHPTVPWNRKKVEMQKMIDDLQAELLLARKAQKLYSRSETDKLRVKLADVESQVRRTSKMDVELTRENDKLRETVAQLESVVEIMESKRYDKTLFERKLYERLREEEETCQDLRTRLQYAIEELDAAGATTAPKRDLPSGDSVKEAISYSEAGSRTPVDATSTLSPQHPPHNSAPQPHTVSSPNLVLRPSSAVASSKEQHATHTPESHHNSALAEKHADLYDATEPSTNSVDELRRAVASSLNTILPTSRRVRLQRAKSAPLNTASYPRSRSISGPGPSPAIHSDRVQQVSSTTTSTGMRQPLLVRQKDFISITNAAPKRKTFPRDSTVAGPPEPAACSSVRNATEPRHFSPPLRECGRERLVRHALYLQEQREKFAPSSGCVAGTASGNASMSRLPTVPNDPMDVSACDRDQLEDESKKRWSLTSSTPVLSRPQVDDVQEQRKGQRQQHNTRHCVSAATTISSWDNVKQQERERQHNTRDVVSKVSSWNHFKEVGRPPAEHVDQKLGGMNGLTKSNHFSFFHALGLNDF